MTPPRGQDPLLILRDLTGANKLIDATQGGLEAVPRIARGDVGLQWVLNLENGLALEANKAASLVASSAAAAGGGTNTTTYALPTSFKADYVFVGITAGAIADLQNANATLFRNDISGSTTEVPLWIWNNGGKSGSYASLDPAGMTTVLENKLSSSLGYPPMMPILLRQDDVIKLYCETTGAAGAGVTVKILLYGWDLRPGLPYPRP